MDLRYNAGGAWEIASQIAYMIAGPNATSGQTFFFKQPNNKHPSIDPNTKETLTPKPFLTKASGKYSAAKDTAYPYLNLERVYVLTSNEIARHRKQLSMVYAASILKSSNLAAPPVASLMPIILGKIAAPRTSPFNTKSLMLKALAIMQTDFRPRT